MHVLLHAPNPAGGQHRPTPPLETPGHSHASLVSFFWGHCSFLLGPRHKVLLCPPRVYLPVLCKFWQLYGGVSDDLLQEDLCHTQVCCTQSSCPCGRAILIRTSTGDPAQAKINKRVSQVNLGIFFNKIHHSLYRDYNEHITAY